MDKIASLFRIILALALIFLCLGVMGGVWASDQLPKIAGQKFGPPSRSLSFSQRTVYSARVLGSEKALLTPLDAKGPPRTFDVALGETVNSIAVRLQEERFISSAEAFRTFLIYAGLDTRVQAGKYEISASMSPVQIARLLQDAVPEDVEFHILAGWRAEEIAAALPISGLSADPGEFLDLVRDPPADLQPVGYKSGASLEGFLMPGQYEAKRVASAHDLLALFIRRFESTVTQDLREAYADRGLDLVQAVTLASMIQREAIVTEEKPIIASVFYNRLGIAMKLDSDPTVQFALGYQLAGDTWWKNPLSRTDLQVDSRYNTYIYPGLPPGPISEPGIDSLRAVAYPAQTGYFYFRARCDGSGRHVFSVTYEEHLQNGCP
jgi:UPF0755 protein